MSSLLSSVALSSVLLSSVSPAASEAPVAGSTWVEPVSAFSSSSLSSGGSETTNLTLDEGGAASGYDGCNWFSGSWEQDGNGISFPGYWTATERACGWSKQWLLEAESAEVAGDFLLVFDENGNRLGTLVRR